MSFTTHNTELPGLMIIDQKYVTDSRGYFLKAFEISALKKVFKSNISEVFFSESHAGTIRGMHFQTPPQDHDKIVFCLTGALIDVVIDLRKGSPTYLSHLPIELNAAKPQALFIPKGFAHGFQALENNTLAAYLVSTSHSPAHDTGILWSSFEFSWPLPPQNISARDQNFLALEKFNSPFEFNGTDE